MGLNKNPQVEALLSWHGHEDGGAKVPFVQGRGRPLRGTLETGLLRKLRSAARELATGSPTACKWVFLVGGPGNGKSEAVEDFVVALDAEMGCQGTLRAKAQERFSGASIRRVEIDASELATPGLFAERATRLVVVHDASASPEDAALELVENIERLGELPESARPTFVCCINRGILARALSLRSPNDTPSRTRALDLLTEVTRATSLADDAIYDRHRCWPLDGHAHVGAWPLDLESIVGQDLDGPLAKMVAEACSTEEWEVAGRCGDCDHAHACPFRWNAAQLRNTARRGGLLKLLRHSELGTGQRWTFRAGFSLIAELVVGQRSDFRRRANQRSPHPCTWVHAQVAGLEAAAGSPSTGFEHALELTRHLYPHALFRRHATRQDARRISMSPQAQRLPSVKEVARALARSAPAATEPIRITLESRRLALLDPADSSPSDHRHELRGIEDAFGQSVAFGAQLYASDLAPAERAMLSALSEAEADWERHERDAQSPAQDGPRLFRYVAGLLVKRHRVGVTGDHPLSGSLAEYAATLRDDRKLLQLRGQIQRLLGERELRASLTATFAQPISSRDSRRTAENTVSLVTPPGVIKTRKAPAADGAYPGHDLASVEMAGRVIPLTFELYHSIVLTAEGCVEASLPSPVRAALGRLRDAHVGTACRDTNALSSNSAVEIKGFGRIQLVDATSAPIFTPDDGSRA